MTPTTHCQVCGRAIKTVAGRNYAREEDATGRTVAERIAHHGYRRPRHGWQTTSCFGARWRP